jgi:hypothetical protein
MEPDIDSYVKSMTGSVIDITQISRWISRCEQSHDRCRIESGIENSDELDLVFPALGVLRLIDVESKCIIETQSLPKYVSLRYVWGSVSNFRLTKANRNKLLMPGSLDEVWGRLPRTIQDAINVTRRLGAQYLWVDSLCLLQNAIGDFDRGVSVMDSIYERAWITVVAIYGHDANAGLPGVRDGSRKASKNVIQLSPAVALGVVIGIDQLLKTSVYSSRAWT